MECGMRIAECGLKTIKTNHESTKFRKQEIYFYFSFFVFLNFRAFVITYLTHD